MSSRAACSPLLLVVAWALALADVAACATPLAPRPPPLHSTATADVSFVAPAAPPRTSVPIVDPATPPADATVLDFVNEPTRAGATAPSVDVVEAGPARAKFKPMQLEILKRHQAPQMGERAD